MVGIERDQIFIALTRPQMFAGVTYSYFVINGVLTTELFLMFHTFWVLLLALFIHLLGVLFCAREPRIFDLWIANLSNCPRIPNYGFWRCNSYQP